MPNSILSLQRIAGTLIGTKPRTAWIAIALCAALSASCQSTAAKSARLVPNADSDATSNAPPPAGSSAPTAQAEGPTQAVAINTAPTAPTAPESSAKAQQPAAVEQPPTAASTVASAPNLQQPDENGDYYPPRLRSDGTDNWQVSDPDPSGLNCRMRQDWQGMTFGHVDPPEDFGKDYSSDIGTWEVVTTFRPGDSLKADGGHLSHAQFVLDRDGKPWLAIATGELNTCFVRANSAFVQPLAPSPL